METEISLQFPGEMILRHHIEWANFRTPLQELHVALFSFGVVAEQQPTRIRPQST